MDVYEAMGRLAGPLEARMQQSPADVLDGICELPTRMEMEVAVAWLAHDYGLLDMIAGEEVNADKTMALVA